MNGISLYQTSCNPAFGLQALPTPAQCGVIAFLGPVAIPHSGYRLFRPESFGTINTISQVAIPHSGYRLFRLQYASVWMWARYMLQSRIRATGSSDCRSYIVALQAEES